MYYYLYALPYSGDKKNPLTFKAFPFHGEMRPPGVTVIVSRGLHLSGRVSRLEWLSVSRVTDECRPLAPCACR